MKYILFILSFVFLLFLIYKANSTIIPFELFILSNKERIIPLSENTCLSLKAAIRARELVDNDYFSHVSSVNGKKPAYWELIDGCFDYSYAGENLIKDFKKAENAHFCSFAVQVP